MFKRSLVFALCSLFLLTVSGCFVEESVYLKKVEENEGMTSRLSDLQQKNSKLSQENEGITSRFSALQQTYNRLSQENIDLKAELKKLTDQNLSLSADKKQLEGSIKTSSDTLSKNITDLNQQVSDLMSENAKLKTEISEIQKAKEERTKEVGELRNQVDGLKVESVRLSDVISTLQKTKEEKVKEVSGTYEKLLADMKSEISKGQVTISELKGKLTVNMAASILFDSGKADVKPEGVEILGKIVETLKGVSDKVIRIEGHSDAVQIVGALARIFPTNWELSAARAINVAKFLQQKGIDPRNLSAAAFAEHKPVADNSSKEGKAKNRRIEITLVPKD